MQDLVLHGHLCHVYVLLSSTYHMCLPTHLVDRAMMRCCNAYVHVYNSINPFSALCSAAFGGAGTGGDRAGQGSDPNQPSLLDKAAGYIPGTEVRTVTLGLMANLVIGLAKAPCL